jgi:DNA-binding response OmpR family regulator
LGALGSSLIPVSRGAEVGRACRVTGEGSGLDVLARLRSEQSYVTLPVVVITGQNSMLQEAEDSIRQLDAEVLYKPQSHALLVHRFTRLTTSKGFTRLRLVGDGARLSGMNWPESASPRSFIGQPRSVEAKELIRRQHLCVF